MSVEPVKNVKQVLRRPMTLLVTSYCLTIHLTYDLAGFTYKSLRNHAQKYYVFVYFTHPTRRVCLRHCAYAVLIHNLTYDREIINLDFKI